MIFASTQAFGPQRPKVKFRRMALPYFARMSRTLHQKAAGLLIHLFTYTSIFPSDSIK